MTDRTTAGVEAEQDEVEALLHNLCGFHLAERDPVQRYTVLTREQVLYEALAAAIRRERGRALAELVQGGHKLTEVAELTGLGTRQRVQRLIHLSAAVEQAPGAQAVTEAQEASRQFEERLAAVEATLDEVVSGVPVLTEPVLPITELPDEDAEILREPFAHATYSSGGYASVRPADDPFDPLTADLSELTGVLEPTRVMPALSAALQVTKEFAADDAWQRRAEEPETA
ncbi:MAG TPA: hypothetical protein VH561_01770 [Micromonosporaceae bacterium]|jgi:hypothetical protein